MAHAAVAGRSPDTGVGVHRTLSGPNRCISPGIFPGSVYLNGLVPWVRMGWRSGGALYGALLSNTADIDTFEYFEYSGLRFIYVGKTHEYC